MFEDFRKFDEAFPYLVKGYPLNSFKGLEESRKNFWKHLASDELNKREMVSDLIAEYARICDAEKDRTLPKKLFSTAWAAQSNTMVSAFWTIYFVTKHGDAKAAAEVEIQRLLKETSQTLNGKTPINFNRNDMDKMTVLDSIINESLRLHVSASMLRQALQDYDLKVLSVGKTYRLRKGDRVMSLFELNHKDPEIYSNPEVFKYDRFLNEDGSLKTDFYKNGKVVRFALQPFGSGLSKCPGRYWAVTELKQIVILLLLYFDFELINPNEEIKMNKNRVAFGSLPPTNDPKIRFRRRVMT
uniref:Uncharacterized protein n=1 Tax=Ciona savignyi TaxID=51511 RepID=H2YXF2_CIOSA